VIGYSAEEMGDDGTAGKQGGFLGQEFITGGKLRMNRQIACHEIARLEQQLAAQQFRVLTDVRTTYYGVLVAQRRVELSRRLVEIAQEGTRTAEQLLKALEASRVDLLQSRIEANRAGILLENAQEDHHAAWRRLAAVVGAPDLTPASLAGDVEDVGSPLDWEEALGRLLSESPELAAAWAEVERARWASRRARVECVPDVDVRGSVHHDNATGDDVVGLEIGVPLPLFDRNQGGIVAADARAIAAERNVQRLRLDLQDRLAGVFREYATARQEVEKYRTSILPDAKEALDLVTKAYSQGEFSYLNLLTAQRTYFQSNLAYLEALLDLQSARARIDGLVLSGSLGETPSGEGHGPMAGLPSPAENR
jgi:cobalt-zinc-cadmium efflux system outer membrane protein